MNRRTKWMRNTRNLIKRLEAENSKLKRFEEYSYYVDNEVTCGRIPLKYYIWIHDREEAAEFDKVVTAIKAKLNITKKVEADESTPKQVK